MLPPALDRIASSVDRHHPPNVPGSFLRPEAHPREVGEAEEGLLPAVLVGLRRGARRGRPGGRRGVGLRVLPDRAAQDAAADPVDVHVRPQRLAARLDPRRGGPDDHPVRSDARVAPRRRGRRRGSRLLRAPRHRPGRHPPGRVDRPDRSTTPCRAARRSPSSSSSRSTPAATSSSRTARRSTCVPPRTIKEKIREALLAIKLEQTLSKDQILARYLNTIYLGHGAYGVQAAAQTYWGIDAADLTVKQSATLAGLITSPSRFDPIDHPEDSKVRRDYALDQMVHYGYLDQAKADELKAEKVTTRRASRGHQRAGQLRVLRGLHEALPDRQVRRRRGLRRRAPGDDVARPRVAARGGGGRERAPPEPVRSGGGAGRDRPADRRDPGDGRRPRVQELAGEPGGLRVAAAERDVRRDGAPGRIVVQGVHAGRRDARRLRPQRHVVRAGHRSRSRTPSATRTARRGSCRTPRTPRRATSR